MSVQPCEKGTEHDRSNSIRINKSISFHYMVLRRVNLSLINTALCQKALKLITYASIQIFVLLGCYAVWIGS